MSKKKFRHAYIDADLAIFPAASAGQEIEYYFVDKNGKEFGSFKSAKAAAGWLSEYEMFGFDQYYGFIGDISELTRQDRIHLKDFEECIKAYDTIIKKWLKVCGNPKYTCYLSKKSGLENFRHSVALRKPYKGNRDPSNKPYYLDQLRGYVLNLPHHKKAVGDRETDDVVTGLASRHTDNILIQNEKDGLQTTGCWVYFPDHHEEPVFSPADTVGYVERVGNKLLGLGHLFLLGQMICGDTADHYSGLDGGGVVLGLATLEPFNNQPIDALRDAVRAVCQLYYDKYGNTYAYKDKSGEDATGSWKDFILESLNLAYMRKGRDDNTPQPFTDYIEEFDKEVNGD